MTLFSVSLPALTRAGTGTDAELAARHAPLLHVDLREPAPPLAMGYSVHRAPAQSPSSKFHLRPPEGGTVIEYAIWHDWDIQHLYDLEHVWVHLDREGEVVRVEGSMHGFRVSLDYGSGLPAMEGARPHLFMEPGKHAIWAEARPMSFIAGAMIRTLCGAEAGRDGVHLGNPFAEAGAYAADARAHRLARLAMRRAAFEPSFEFEPAPEPALTDWATLAAWIPARMRELISALPCKVPHLEGLFLDCGDTLIDETTEVKRPGTEVVLEAEEIPGAMDAVRALDAMGYPLVLVADGPRETFENLLKPRGIWHLMQAHVISGDVGELKPAPVMFETALQGLGVQRRSRVVMVGNNLERDIAGANAAGLVSLFVAWSKKRSHAPASPAETPDFRIDRLEELPGMIDAIELALETLS
ncbi:HAD family hydrolase [Roseibium sp. Sym1]|uniref:HAD family hydrolase n=1 Tax=Roseibium sp. Sym1 TaxID=3016006 RepID=UPI0022B5661F|nr:HAD family hydrolase [Roseibium sp. Sym1]